MRRTALALIALPAAGLLLAACSSTGAVTQADVESQISSQIAAEVGVTPESVSCPGDLAATVGTTMQCTLVSEGQTFPVDISVTAVDGTNVNFDISVGEPS
jgi:hypothetical protein